MNTTAKILIILCLTCLSKLSFSQNDTLIFKVHPSIGDTVDYNEKIKYNLFTDIPNNNFKYVQYLSVKGKVFIRTYLVNGSYYDKPYTTEKFFNDGYNINASQIKKKKMFDSVNIKPSDRKNYKPQLKLVNTSNNKTVVLREKQTFNFLLQEKVNNLYFSEIHGYSQSKKSSMHSAKLLKIYDTGEPSIKVELYYGDQKQKVIPLADIQMISKSIFKNKHGKTVIGALILILGTALTYDGLSSDNSFSTKVGIGSGVCGLTLLAIPIRCFDFDKDSEIQISYY